MNDRDALKLLFDETALLRFSLLGRNPKVKHFSDWERHASVMRTIEQVLRAGGGGAELGANNGTCETQSGAASHTAEVSSGTGDALPKHD